MDRLTSWLGRLPLAGTLITLMAMLALWRDNYNRLPIESAWPTIAALAVIALSATALLRPLTGDWARAGLVSGLVAIYLFYVPAILGLAPMPRLPSLLAHIAFIAALGLIALGLPRQPDRLRELAGKCNLLCIVLLAITAIPLAIQQISLEGPRRQAQRALKDFEGQAKADSPDVWHILFDRYAGADTLRDSYGYDNGPFIAELRRRGFNVSDQAFSNYQRTAHSVASTMNGTLLDPMSAPMNRQAHDWVPIYRSLRDNAALRFFERAGYRTIFAGSWWEPTRFSGKADESLRIRAMPQLARLAIDTSSLGVWTKGVDLPYLNGRGDQCLRAKEKFRRLRQLSRAGERKYVFAHFLVPHPPFVLNADGSCRSIGRARASSRRDNYVAQLQFANREVLALVDSILAGPRPAVIIIHSDEGPWPEPHVGDEQGLGTDPVEVNWARMPQPKLREKMSILLAVRSPQGPPSQMPSSPVQIYPAVLLEHFGSAAQLPPSRHFVFQSDAQIYRFHDVTTRFDPR
ncbi:MAG TPA: sulfatase-like hydrolase/transferase [Sphingomicrobium sp.]|nr:sulfatase-like hydrolase/transferase [Sphingomicrobium sp.]